MKKSSGKETQAVRITTDTTKKASKRSGALGAEELEAEASDESWQKMPPGSQAE